MITLIITRQGTVCVNAKLVLRRFMSKKRISGTNIGASSILIIVIILSLVSFAGLSLASANADYKLCRKLADRTTDYYAATSKAYEELARECGGNKDESSRVSLNIAINDVQELCVEALLHPADNERYRISKFMVVNVNEPELDNSLSLLN